MPTEPKKLATAEFTKDMVETLGTYFDEYQVGGVVKIDVTDRGLWLPVPGTKGQKFLGSVTVFDQPAKLQS